MTELEVVLLAMNKVYLRQAGNPNFASYPLEHMRRMLANNPKLAEEQAELAAVMIAALDGHRMSVARHAARELDRIVYGAG